MNEEYVAQTDAFAVLRALWALDHSLSSRSKRMESTLGVTSPQRLVLRVIQESPGISAGGIATALSLHPSTVTGIIARLEARDRVVRKVDPDDRRRMTFRLSPGGEEIASRREGTVEEVIARVLDGTSDGDRRAAVALLLRLASALDPVDDGRAQVRPSADEG